MTQFPHFPHPAKQPVFPEDFPDERANFFHKVGESVNEWEKVVNRAYFWVGEKSPCSTCSENTHAASTPKAV